jgi:hypothetical protein
MAEQEIINHTKKAFTIWGSREHSLWEKLKEFLTEIFIIVFAITLSIWFHNWSEHRAEQNQVKVFLLGLKRDIQADIADTKEIVSDYKYFDTAYTFLSNLKADKQPNKDSLHSFVSTLTTNSFLRPHKSRFDGFISSGKMLTIESDSLVSNILLYYQEAIPAIKSSEGGWLSIQAKLLDYVFENIKDTDTDMDYWHILATAKGRHLSKNLIPWQQLFSRYGEFTRLGQTIIEQIDAEYPPK